jgi:FMN reductase (NADPH)/FMN reductase [NAD(P)H]
MNSEILDVIHQRKSVRAYEDKPIPEDVRQTILDATLRAPTAGNMMLYSIIEVNDQAKKDRLVETCDNQPFIATAPWVLLFLADYQRWYDYFEVSKVEHYCLEVGTTMIKPEEGDLMLACCDALIAAQTAVIVAESMGLGSCYIGDILENFEIHQEMFSLPPYAIPIAMLCLGYPTQEQQVREKTSRFEPEFIVHENEYRRIDEAGYVRMFSQRQARLRSSGSASTNIGLALYKRKFSAAYSKEMRRSVTAMLRSWVAG